MNQFNLDSAKGGGWRNRIEHFLDYHIIRVMMLETMEGFAKLHQQAIESDRNGRLSQPAESRPPPGKAINVPTS